MGMRCSTRSEASVSSAAEAKPSAATGPLTVLERSSAHQAQAKNGPIERTKFHLSRGWGYLCASTWLQCVPPYGPNHKPGGDGSMNHPGIRWWLEFVKKNYGPYTLQKQK